MTDVTEHLCFETDLGFICNQKPNHDGDHVAIAAQCSGDKEHEAHRWPRAGSTASKGAIDDAR